MSASGFDFAETAGQTTCGSLVQTTLSDATRRSAVLTVASMSQDSTDCARMLSMLGLAASEGKAA